MSIKLSKVRLNDKTRLRAQLIMEWLLQYGKKTVSWSTLVEDKWIVMRYVKDKIDPLLEGDIVLDVLGGYRIRADAPKYMRRVYRLQAQKDKRKQQRKEKSCTE